MTRPSIPPRDPSDLRIRRTWHLFAGAFFVLGLLTVLRLFGGPARPLDWVVVVLVLVVGYAAIRHRVAVEALEVSRRMEAEGFARILSGLSRSVSPDAIVDAIVEELGTVTGADHIVVVRRRLDARTLEATLVSSRPGVAPSTTQLPLSDLVDPEREVVTVRRPADLAPAGGVRGGRPPVAIPIVPDLPAFETAALTPAPALAGIAGIAGSVALPAAGVPPSRGVPPVTRSIPVAAGPAGGAARPGRAEAAAVDPGSQRVADRIAVRVGSLYGLSHTLTALLVVDAEPVGAIVLSRRLATAWPASTGRLLAAAAAEASAALSRAYSHRQAETLASTDALTGLPNRRYFDEFCGLLARRRRADDAVGVLMIDIDRFKTLNDRFGHAVGDEVLRAVAGAIAGAVREADVPARYGGEEFAVLLRNPGRAVAVEVGERVRAAVRDADLRRFGVAGVSVSVGVAVAASADEPIEAVVRAADEALYRAKRGGRDRVVAA